MDLSGAATRLNKKKGHLIDISILRNYVRSGDSQVHADSERGPPQMRLATPPGHDGEYHGLEGMRKLLDE